MRRLRIAASVTLPADLVTEPVGMFANRGKGKSNAAHRLVEQLYHAGLPAIVLDVKGDWFGIRSSADGTKPGLPFLIVGGDHGDLVLEAGSGASWARFLSEQRVPTVIDLKNFSKTAARRWAMEFAEELYRVNREPLMLVVDEADVIIPQRLSADLMRLLGAMEDIAKRGRQRGLGMLVVSQRMADVNKSVTDLLETVFFFMISGSRTRKAALEWIDDHGDLEEAKKVVATLSSLEPGECWLWSPGWLRLLKRFIWERIETFDSHATPKAGETRRTIKTMADIDLSAVKEQMADTIERAQAEDPKVLRARIALLEKKVEQVDSLRAEFEELEQQLAETKGALQAAEGMIESVRATPVEVPVITDEQLQRLEKMLSPATEVIDELRNAVVVACDMIAARPDPPTSVPRPKAYQDTVNRPRARSVKEVTTKPNVDTSASATVEGSDFKMGKGHRRILTVLAQYPAGRRRQQLTSMTGYVYSGGFRNLLGALRAAGYITGGNEETMKITAAGLEALGVWEPMPTGEALLQYWLNEKSLGKGGKTVLSTLVEEYPEGMDGPALAAATGYEYSGGFRNILGRLRTLELIVGANTAVVTAHPDFMEAIGRSGGR